MNRTKLFWSKNLKCYKVSGSFDPFIIISSIFCTLPFFFYLGCYLYAKREDRLAAASALNIHKRSVQFQDKDEDDDLPEGII